MATSPPCAPLRLQASSKDGNHEERRSWYLVSITTVAFFPDMLLVPWFKAFETDSELLIALYSRRPHTILLSVSSGRLAFRLRLLSCATRACTDSRNGYYAIHQYPRWFGSLWPLFFLRQTEVTSTTCTLLEFPSFLFQWNSPAHFQDLYTSKIYTYK